MSIFGTIMSKIFHHGEAAAAPAPGATASANPQASAAAPSGGSPAPTSANRSSPPPATPDDPTAIGRTSSAGSSTGSATQSVDVGQVLDGLAAKNSQKLDWRHSIVDMMKLLDLDSSLSARQTLAKELSYSGDMQDSAAMNIWLHKAVMQKLAQNGGKVPADLKV
jgi:hypothetical protein